MKFANFRAGHSNGCEHCTCRSRSDFFFLDDGSTYNVDTGGAIWYQAAGSFEWSTIYQCRNYIPWSNGVSRLDHVMRDEQGAPSGYAMRTSRRIPCGRPDSGSFIGFQTDTDSGVVFYNGKLVYEGMYRSDSDGMIGVSSTDFDMMLGTSSSSYRNWITEECEEGKDCNQCNNNDPLGNERRLFRNTDGKWDTNTWEHKPGTEFVEGELTSVFTQSVTFIDPPCAQCSFGWMIGGGSSSKETGFHLGTNENGRVVWFTTRKRCQWWRFAGIVASVDDLPDILQLPEWEVVDEDGEPCPSNPNLQDFDVLVVGSCPCEEECDCYRKFAPYYLRDGQWIKHEAATYAELVIGWDTACILHESTKGVTQEVENGICVKKPDAWVGNAASVQSCGDLVLVNGNRKELDRLLIYRKEVIAEQKAVGRKADVEMQDSVECGFSRHYWNREFEITGSCKAADGYAFAKFTLADGSIRHVVTYFDGDEWSGQPLEYITAPGEPTWESGLGTSNKTRHSVYWLAIGREMPDGTHERKIIYKGEEKAYFIYDPTQFQGDSFKYMAIPIGLFATCTAVYVCPDSYSGIPKYTVWDERGNALVSCSDDLNFECMESTSEENIPLPWAFSLPGVVHQESASWSYQTRDEFGQFQSVSVTETVYYREIFVPEFGETFYDGGHMQRATTTSSGTRFEAFGAADEHWSPADLSLVPSTCQNPRPYAYRPVESTNDIGFINIVNTTRSLVSVCGTWYADKPAIIGEVQVVDNDLDAGTVGGSSPSSFDITLCALIGTIPAASAGSFVPRPTILIKDTCHQTIEFSEPGPGKNRPWQQNPGQIHTTSFSRPVWNRVFFQHQYDTGSNFEGRALYYGNWPDAPGVQKSYMGVKVLGDANGVATDGLIIDHLAEGAASPLQNIWWHPDGSVWKLYLYYLEAEVTRFFDGIGSPVDEVTRYTTHVWEIEAGQESGRLVNASPTYYREDYHYRVVEIPGESPLIFGRLEETLWYKLCTTPNLQFYTMCGYLFIWSGSGGNMVEQMFFEGVPVYTSPTIAEYYAGTADWYVWGCCNGFIVMAEMRDDVTKYYAFAGKTPVPLDTDKPISFLGCCGTHFSIHGIPEYRYALFDSGDYSEVADMPLTLQELQDKLIEDSEFQEPPITLTDGTLATRRYNNGTPTVEFETSDGVRFIPNESLVKKTIDDTRQRMVCCNNELLGSNKRYDGIHCCDEYVFCVYVEDENLSGWRNERYTEDSIYVDRKYTAHPGWGDAQPPPASDREAWDYYKSVYPGFAVDVFYKGEPVGTFKLSDANSPIYYDKLLGSTSWRLLGIWEVLGAWLLASYFEHGIGQVPWTLEGTPKCGSGKLQIPYDGGLTTVIGTASERKVFP